MPKPDAQTFQSQLYIALPDCLEDDFEKDLKAVLQSGFTSTVMMKLSSVTGRDGFGKRLCTLSQDYGVAFLIGVDEQTLDHGLELLTSWQADGLHFLTTGMDVKKVRKAIGSDVILGGFCGLSRHDAMLLGEGGADYIAIGVENPDESETEKKSFDHILVFLQWYLEVFELPVVSWDCRSLKQARQLIKGEVDFIAVNDLLWSPGKEAGEIMKQFTQILSDETQLDKNA